MRYVVATCHYTMELHHTMKEAYGCWIPIIREPRREAGGGITFREASALPGYIFVATSEWPAFRNAAPPRFSVAAMSYKHSGAPRTVAVAEIVDMQDTINKLFHSPARTGRASEPLYQDLPIGCRVRLKAAPFDGMVGIVEKLRASTARVLVGTKYITIGRAFVEMA